MVARYSRLEAGEVERAVWSEIWSLAQMHHRRYQHLRQSVKFLVLTLPLYLASMLFLLLVARLP
jgi:hypothetical protein